MCGLTHACDVDSHVKKNKQTHKQKQDAVVVADRPITLYPPKRPVDSPSTPLLLCIPSSRCVMKMDHHCPWINNCCGHVNHAYFTSFLLLAPLGCSHAAIIFIMTMYTQLYERVNSLLSPLLSTARNRAQVASFILAFHAVFLFYYFFFPTLQISFGWSTVKIDMSAVRQFQPLMPFSVPAFAATLFALGLALGTTIAVGMLFVIQASFHSGAYRRLVIVYNA